MGNVIIEHADGRSYGVARDAFSRSGIHADGESYAKQGFKIVANEDGSALKPGKDTGERSTARDHSPVPDGHGPADGAPPADEPGDEPVDDEPAREPAT